MSGKRKGANFSRETMPYREELRYFAQRSVLTSSSAVMSTFDYPPKQHFANLLKQNQPNLSSNPGKKRLP